MKKILPLLPVAIFFLIDAFISVLLFVLLSAEYKTTNFYVGWAFAAVGGFLAFVGFLVYGNKDRSTRLIAFNSLILTCIVFQVIYIIWFVIATFAFKDKLVVVNVAIEVVITVLYLIVVLVKFFGVHYLREVNADQAKVVAEKKSSFIPQLMQMIDTALSAATDEDVKKQLIDLASFVEGSPKSAPDSVAIVERELRAVVYQINQYVSLREYGEIGNLVSKAKSKLMERNAKCSMK